MLEYDPTKNSALLIGTSGCGDARLSAVPSVAVGLKALKEHFTPHFARCQAILNRIDPGKLLTTVTKVCRNTTGGLLVFYSGHALLRDDQLYLSLSKTTCDDYANNALKFTELAKRVADSPAAKKIIILDCCHAESGLLTIPTLRTRTATQGLYSIAAAQSHEGAKAMAAGEPTLLTGELLRALRGGAVSKARRQNSWLTIDDVFQTVKGRFDSRRKVCPDTPHIVRNLIDTGDEIVIGRILEPHREVAAAAIGASLRKLPVLVEENVKIIGFFQMAQLAVELEELVTEARKELDRWRDEVTYGLADWAPREMVVGKLREVRRAHSVLASRCMKYESWHLYSDVAREAHKHLDRFLVRLMRIVDGYDPDEKPPTEQFVQKREPATRLSDVRDRFIQEESVVYKAMQPIEQASQQLRERYEDKLDERGQ